MVLRVCLPVCSFLILGFWFGGRRFVQEDNWGASCSLIVLFNHDSL